MSKTAGFTLIELSIVISILAVLTTVALASFVGYSRTQALQTASYDLITALNLAKSRAFSQVKPPQCSQQPLDGYKVWIPTSTSFELDAICAGNIYKTGGGNFPKDVSVSTGISTSTSFFFPVISGPITGSGYIVLSLAGYNKTRTITVDSVGTVK